MDSKIVNFIVMNKLIGVRAISGAAAYRLNRSIYEKIFGPIIEHFYVRLIPSMRIELDEKNVILFGEVLNETFRFIIFVSIMVFFEMIYKKLKKFYKKRNSIKKL